MFCGGFGRYIMFRHLNSIQYGWMFLSAAFKLLIFIGIVVIAVKLFKNYSNKSNESIKIIDEKFAKGEISEEEYLKRRTILSQKN